MDTKYLNYILAIAKKKNMTKAAEELYVSQSSLSQYLARLEQEIGVPLFIRNRNELTLTPAGELYIKAARQVLQIKDELYSSIRSLHNKSRITIGVTSQFGLNMLAEIIPQYKKQFPDVTIEISETNVPALAQLILNGAIDCGIMALNTIEPFRKDQVEILGEEEVFFAIPSDHPYCLSHPHGAITPEELVTVFHDANFLLSRKGSTLRNLTDSIFSSYHFVPSTVCETNSITATRSMVAKGIGVTFIAASCACDREHVAYYSLNPALSRHNALVRKKGWVMNQPEHALLDCFHQYFKSPDSITG